MDHSIACHARQPLTTTNVDAPACMAVLACLQAHNLVGGHMISVNEMLAIPLKNTSKKCVISVETLVTSSSGENKFKIISAESRALNPGSPLPLSKKDKGKRSKNPGRIG